MLWIGLLASADAAERRLIANLRPADAQGFPFRDRVLVGDTLHCRPHRAGSENRAGAGRRRTRSPPGDGGIKTTVEAAGMSIDDVVSLLVFVPI
jgi:hypothetical protein